MASEFEKLLALDVKTIFLTGEFSIGAIFRSGSTIKTIRVQFFEEPLDKMGTQYYHAWCNVSDVPHISKGDTLTINSIEYGVVDFAPDEFNLGMNIFLGEV